MLQSVAAEQRKVCGAMAVTLLQDKKNDAVSTVSIMSMSTASIRHYCHFIHCPVFLLFSFHM